MVSHVIWRFMGTLKRCRNIALSGGGITAIVEASRLHIDSLGMLNALR